MCGMQLVGVFNRVVTAALVIATSSLIERSQSIEFTIEPGDISTPLHLMLNVTFRCSLSDPNLRPHWIVKFPDIMQNLSTRNNNDMLILIARGVTYDSSSITIPGVVKNNRTLIRCAAFKFSGITEFSDPVKLTIIGPPLPPDPVSVTLCASQLEIRWEIPYSPDNYTIESYNFEVVKRTSQDLLVTVMQQNETSYRIALKGMDQVTSCHLLTIRVTAVSVVGESEPGIVMGGFPIAPQSFQSEIDVELTFHRNGSPIVEVTFEAPRICEFQTSNYTIIIEESGLPLLSRQSTYTGGSRSIVEIFDSVLLQPNRNYTLTVSVQDKHFDGMVLSNTTKFSTTFDPRVGSFTSGLDIEIYAGAGGGILFVILVSVALVATILICSRKWKNHAEPGATMDKMLNNNNRMDEPDSSDPFAAVPPTRETTGQGSVYETINEYREAKKNTMLSQQQQNYQWKLQQLEIVESEREALEDSAYQVMSSASINGDIPESAGAATTSRFTYPQPYPNSPQSPNGPNPLMMPQQSVAASDDTDPYGYDNSYHFRPCPASAAAGSTLSPIHESHYDNDVGAHGQFYHTHNLHNQAAMDELDIDPDMDEEDQDYTFMSQAGTLTSQTGMTVPYLSCSDNDQSPSQCGYVTTPKHLRNIVSGHNSQCTTSRDSKC